MKPTLLPKESSSGALAPITIDRHHVLHAYTLEPWPGWQRGADYAQRKAQRAAPLFPALENIIPDLCQRLVLELLGTPLTHQRFLRRYRGTYGPAIGAGQGVFPNCFTPVAGLLRVGDSTLPGIGVPAVAASGILCANTLVPPEHVSALVASMSSE
ncbi:hypothetical protein XM38_020050 [Halomicronema hongdechloris C2206]|uniref:Uncharacterized protein n=1 Tax=Halomicronema hongdechloris C2206 TaxID=1641165 RepID=A0A1Z3HL97_9CYAN|nr:hypothetical protein XM38_020050 [Halomicronema hongdechloris C2206]